jgi:ElaB/YqjD/DUF883 family membrane-anchored ribosome-binding protein
MSNVETLGASAQDAKRAVEETVTDLRDKGEEAADRALETFGTLRDMLDDSIRKRPYTTMAMAAAAGFLYAVMRRN